MEILFFEEFINISLEEIQIICGEDDRVTFLDLVAERVQLDISIREIRMNISQRDLSDHLRIVGIESADNCHDHTGFDRKMGLVGSSGKCLLDNSF